MNSFAARTRLQCSGRSFDYYSLDALAADFEVAKLPFSIRILLENLLRTEDGKAVTRSDIETVASWTPGSEPHSEIAFTPSRVLLQDFTGVPAVVDLAAMRAAMQRLGGDPNRINPLQPAQLVIDHSVQVDRFGDAEAFAFNIKMEQQRNRERYRFLRWGQQSFENFEVVPPGTGIVHQVNLEYLASVVFTREDQGTTLAYPDTLVGTDSHTTMINGLGVLGWGVGGIEAEAAMLGQPVSMLIPHVVGFEVTGKLPEGSTATDLVLRVVEMLRAKGVVGKFVEFFGDGLDHLSLADRATVANMAPEYGATCGLFPIDRETLRYLELSGRSEQQVALIEAYARAQGFFREPGSAAARYSDTLKLDLADVEPAIAGPKRPQDRITLSDAPAALETALSSMDPAGGGTAVKKAVSIQMAAGECKLEDGAVVIAAITSCTNTSNPAVMMAAGLLARKARAKGLQVKPWVKTSLAPGSQVVTEYLRKAELLEDLNALGFNVVGYGCTTCIGNSGPLPEPVAEAITGENLAVCSVLSGNRNFEGRVHPLVKLNYLASPPLVVAYAIAGSMEVDLTKDPLGETPDGEPVYLADVWPSNQEITEFIDRIAREMFTGTYADVFTGDSEWNSLEIPEGSLFAFEDDSTYIKEPPFFRGLEPEPAPLADFTNLRALALLGDSVTTDHISPAGSFTADSPAGTYLRDRSVDPRDFNSYGSRRGNHEVMMRGTFANVRLRNRLAPGTEGGFTSHIPSGDTTTIFEASERYRADGVGLIVIAGKEYGSGSSRDWAAKGPKLLGVRAVIAESYERIHRSNLIGMGILPLQFRAGDSADSLGLTGRERFTIEGLGDGSEKEVDVIAADEGGAEVRFPATVRIDTANEVQYFVHGGILQFVLRRMRES